MDSRGNLLLQTTLSTGLALEARIRGRRAVDGQMALAALQGDAASPLKYLSPETFFIWAT